MITYTRMRKPPDSLASLSAAQAIVFKVSRRKTLEFRICDIPTKVDDTIAVAALFQAIVAKLDTLIEKNLGFRLYHRRLIQENKWRAIRYGLDGMLLDLGKQKEVPVKDLIRELLDFVDEVVDPLGSR